MMKKNGLVWTVLLFPACRAYEVPRVACFYSGSRLRSIMTGQRPLSPGRWRQPTSRRPVSMKVRVAILGLPNVGKSSLFNALAQKAIAQAANFPFCTIEPNVAPVAVPDPYLAPLADLAGTPRAVAATLEWVDVAGLAKGAHRGEGLGNKFLATARECDAVCHVVRCFEDDDTVHVDGQVDPRADAEALNLELLLADLAQVERRLARSNDDDEAGERAALGALAAALERGVPARAAFSRGGGGGGGGGAVSAGPAADRAVILAPLLRSMGLLTLKPMLYALNVDEVDFAMDREAARARAAALLRDLPYCGEGGEAGGGEEGERGKEEGERGEEEGLPPFALVSASLESTVGALPRKAQAAYLRDVVGLERPNLPRERGHGGGGGGGGAAVEVKEGEQEGEEEEEDDRLSHRTLPALVCGLLDLAVCYTGPGVPSEKTQTTRAHLFFDRTGGGGGGGGGGGEKEGGCSTSAAAFTAGALAGRIHGDLARGFLRAEVVPASSLLGHGSYARAKEAGAVRTEGKDYAIQPHDVVLIKWK